MTINESPNPPATIGAFWTELRRQVKQGFAEGMAKAKAEREAKATPTGDPAPGLSVEERAKLERLLTAWPGNGNEGAQA